MKMRHWLPVLALALPFGAVAAPPDPAETRIRFVGSEGILDWKAAADDAVYIRGADARWYLVKTTNRCTRLWTALALGFQISANDQLDRYGAIIAQGQRCPVASVTLSTEPPRKPRRKAR